MSEQQKELPKVSMRDLLEAGVHFGHKTRYWNPQMSDYIYGSRQKLHIFNLEKTLPMFRAAQARIAEVAKNRGRVLFVGTKFAAREIIKEEATRCGMPYVDYRWLGGMLTNYKTIRQSIKRLKDLEAIMDSPVAKKLTKKELLKMSREQTKLALVLTGIKEMGGLPDALFIVDVGNEDIAIKEANLLKIPVIGVVDTNCSPNGVDYVIPGNDDSQRAIRLYCSTMAETIIQSRGKVVAEKDKIDVKKKAAKKAPEAKAEADVKSEAAKPKEKVEAKTDAEQAETAKPVKKVVKKTVTKPVEK